MSEWSLRPRKGGLSVYGTNVLMNISNDMGALPTKNSQLASFGERGEMISGEYVNEHILVNDPTCHACPVACKKEVEIKEGPYKGSRMESVEYESAWALGANCDNDNIASIAKIIDQCNDYGLDTIEMGNVLSMYMEASEKGYTNGTGGLKWGDCGSDGSRRGKSLPGKALATTGRRAPNARAKAFGHPEISMTVQRSGDPGLRPARHQGHGAWLCYQQPRRLPPARLHPAAEVVGNVLGPL